MVRAESRPAAPKHPQSLRTGTGSPQGVNSRCRVARATHPPTPARGEGGVRCQCSLGLRPTDRHALHSNHIRKPLGSEKQNRTADERPSDFRPGGLRGAQGAGAHTRAAAAIVPDREALQGAPTGGSTISRGQLRADPRRRVTGRPVTLGAAKASTASHAGRCGVRAPVRGPSHGGGGVGMGKIPSTVWPATVRGTEAKIAPVNGGGEEHGRWAWRLPPGRRKGLPKGARQARKPDRPRLRPAWPRPRGQRNEGGRPLSLRDRGPRHFIGGTPHLGAPLATQHIGRGGGARLSPAGADPRGGWAGQLPLGANPPHAAAPPPQGGFEGHDRARAAPHDIAARWRADSTDPDCGTAVSARGRPPPGAAPSEPEPTEGPPEPADAWHPSPAAGEPPSLPPAGGPDATREPSCTWVLGEPPSPEPSPGGEPAELESCACICHIVRMSMQPPFSLPARRRLEGGPTPAVPPRRLPDGAGPPAATGRAALPATESGHGPPRGGTPSPTGDARPAKGGADTTVPSAGGNPRRRLETGARGADPSRRCPSTPGGGCRPTSSTSRTSPPGRARGERLRGRAAGPSPATADPSPRPALGTARKYWYNVPRARPGPGSGAGCACGPAASCS